MHALPAILAGLVAAALPPTTTVQWSQPLMGTTATITVATADSAHTWPAARLALASMARVDSLMSNWSQTSEVARLNRTAPSRTVRVQSEVSTVLGYALEVGRRSRGAFDVTVEPLVRLWGFLGEAPTVPSPDAIADLLPHVGQRFVHFDPQRHTLRFDRPDLKIDLGGVAKGYGVDRAAASLEREGLGDFLVDISGNMVARGHPPGRDHWTVGVRDPSDRIPYFARLRLRDEAIATSGNYEQFVDAGGERFGHILDPRTGWPVSELVSVTVVAPEAMQADAWATALCVLGLEEARDVIRNSKHLRAILVARAEAESFEVWVDRRLASAFRASQRSAARFRFHTF